MSVASRVAFGAAYFSAANGKEFALRELIAGGVSPNAVPGEESLLMAAARHEQLGVMRLLIAAGADVNYKFHVAISPDELLDAATSALSAGKYNAARLLLSAGYTPTKGGPAQTRELFFAAIAGGAIDETRRCDRRQRGGIGQAGILKYRETLASRVAG